MRKSSEEPETSVIPIDGPWARIGAARYLAVVAYPLQNDWPKRDRFVEAAAHWLDRVRGVGGRQMRETRIDGAFNKAFHLLQTRRLPAARAARWISLMQMLTRSPWRELWKDGKVPRVPGPNRMALRYFRETERLEQNQEFAGLMRYRSDRKRNSKPKSKPNLTNILRRVWKETMPVLHLAVAFVETAPGEISGQAHRLEYHILNPHWLIPALARAESLRGSLQSIVASFTTENAIRLSPCMHNSRQPNTLRSLSVS